jgi:hypothetical protein
MSPQYPRITISDTSAYEPALITAILQFAGIRTEEVDLSVETSDIILSAMHVGAHEVPREPVAEPVPGFRLKDPVFPASVVRERPCVELPRYVQRPFGSEPDLYSQIRIQESVCQDIALGSHSLGFDILRNTGDGDCQQDEHSFYNSIIHTLNYCVTDFTVCPSTDIRKDSCGVLAFSA